jgi:dihydrodipicolinate synthase/N-acetylneuraminate lyase
MTLNLDGLIPATVLPMDADGRIDEPALRSYIAWVAGQGPVALAINVDTGEGPHLTHEEKVRVLQVVREVTDLPIVAGLAGPSTEAAVRQARDFKAVGADALLVFPIPAYLSEPLDVRVPVSYHEAIAQVGLPLILFQLQPALAGLNYEPDTLRAMASVEGVVAIKEASFDARRFVDTARLIADLPRPITMLTGNDNFILESFMLGATGALIGFGAVMTREQVDMIEAWDDGRIEDAKALGRRVQRLADVVFAAPVGDYRVRLKECLRILGVLESAHVRRPLMPLRDGGRRQPFLTGRTSGPGLLAPLQWTIAAWIDKLCYEPRPDVDRQPCRRTGPVAWSAFEGSQPWPSNPRTS